jgi:hypothetical protein
MDDAQRNVIALAMQRLLDGLQAATPHMAQPVGAWMRALAGGHAPEAYFTHDLAFPTLLLPWWLEQSLGREPAQALQANLAYSSINGYYFIRMIDNVMDGEATVETQLLPALAYFHTEFQTAYQAHFAPAHPFWTLYRKVWFGTADAAIHDARLDSITLEMFNQASAQKVRAALIPVAAVCHTYARADLIEPWSEFVYRMGKWHQMLNDTFDWHKDSRNGNMTYFLSEAQRHKRDGETPTDWIVRTGFETGCDTLRTWMRDAQTLAATLNCPALLHYLADRSTQFERRAQDALAGFAALGKLAAAFK